MDPLIPFITGLMASSLHQHADRLVLLLDGEIEPELHDSGYSLRFTLRSGKRARITVTMEDDE